MARFLGGASGRTTVTYTDAAVAANVPGATLLYNCACYCATTAACIPSTSRGVYQRYEIMGSFCSWNYYCSQFAAAFAGACGGSCSCNDCGTYCCSISSCGNINTFRCFGGSYPYTCAGAIAWPFGCASGCLSACNGQGFQYHAALTPQMPCCGSNRSFSYCFRTTRGDTANYHCCFGISNVGCATPCCGAHPSCLQCVCFTTPSNSSSHMGNIIIVGYGRLSV